MPTAWVPPPHPYKLGSHTYSQIWLLQPWGCKQPWLSPSIGPVLKVSTSSCAPARHLPDASHWHPVCMPRRRGSVYPQGSTLTTRALEAACRPRSGVPFITGWHQCAYVELGPPAVHLHTPQPDLSNWLHSSVHVQGDTVHPQDSTPAASASTAASELTVAMALATSPGPCHHECVYNWLLPLHRHCRWLPQLNVCKPSALATITACPGP